MKYLVRCLHAVERDPDEWGDTVGSSKRTINSNELGRSVNNGIPHASTNLAVTAVETVTTAKPTTPAYSYTVAAKPDYSQFTCGFYRKIGHIMWQCEKYLALNLTARREYIQHNGRCTNCLSRHTIANCTSY